MPTDLEQAFAALSEDAGHLRLAPAAALRRRADRQTLTRSLTGVATAALLVAGVAVGSRLVLADDARPPLPPGQTATPTTAPPSVAPSATASPSPPSSPSSSTMPSSIPARAFLNRSDANVLTLTRLDQARTGPELCDRARYPSTRLIGVDGSVQLLFRPAGQGEEYTASGYVTDTIMVFRSGGAEQFMAEFRAAVRACPEGDRDALTYTYRSLGPLGAGDESVLVQGATPARGDDGEPADDGSQHYLYLAAVRVGDSVALVETTGFESVSAERKDAERFARKAAQRLAAWRG